MIWHSRSCSFAVDQRLTVSFGNSSLRAAMIIFASLLLSLLTVVTKSEVSVLLLLMILSMVSLLVILDLKRDFFEFAFQWFQ